MICDKSALHGGGTPQPCYFHRPRIRAAPQGTQHGLVTPPPPTGCVVTASSGCHLAFVYVVPHSFKAPFLGPLLLAPWPLSLPFAPAISAGPSDFLSPSTPHRSPPQSLYHTLFLLLSLAFPSAQPSPLALPSPVHTPLSSFYCRFFPWEEGLREEGPGNEQRDRTFLGGLEKERIGRQKE